MKYFKTNNLDNPIIYKLSDKFLYKYNPSREEWMVVYGYLLPIKSQVVQKYIAQLIPINEVEAFGYIL